MDFTAFRQNVQDMFQRELGVTMVPGQLDGPNQWSATEWQGSVVIAKFVENPRNVGEIQISLIARFFAPFSSQGQVNVNVPYDPTPLEQMAAQIQQAVQRNQTGLGAWFIRATGLEFDVEDQGIQVTIFALTENDATNLA